MPIEVEIDPRTIAALRCQARDTAAFELRLSSGLDTLAITAVYAGMPEEIFTAAAREAYVAAVQALDANTADRFQELREELNNKGEPT
jgi:hypothetical protein